MSIVELDGFQMRVNASDAAGLALNPCRPALHTIPLPKPVYFDYKAVTP